MTGAVHAILFPFSKWPRFDDSLFDVDTVPTAAAERDYLREI